MNAMAAGIISGFQQAGRTVPPVSMNTATEGDVAFLYDNLDDGYFAVSSVGSGASQLNAAFRAAMRIISGQGPITSEFITEAPLITPDNVADYYVPRHRPELDGDHPRQHLAGRRDRQLLRQPGAADLLIAPEPPP